MLLGFPQPGESGDDMGRTLYEKVWNRHVVRDLDDGTALLYIDRHLVHEVTSPQAFEGLRLAGRAVRRPELTFATMDHNVPTDDPPVVTDPIARAQIEALERNCADFGLRLFGLKGGHNGIVHIIGPELGITLPGATIVCGDSHTATHGAFGALAFGIGTSEVEHVLATQTLRQRRSRTFRVEFTGRPGPWVTAKDLILALIGRIGTAGATGCVLEYAGEAIRSLSMEGRMTVCNMSIEAGARAGIIAPDDTTFAYIAEGERPFAPRGRALDEAIARWRKLPSDPDAAWDRELTMDAAAIAPQVTWGTSPGMVTDVTGRVPEPGAVPGYSRSDVEQALRYMGLTPGTPITDIRVDLVFIGSCTNGRIEDLRIAAAILKGREVSIRTIVVPATPEIWKQAIDEGLAEIFYNAGCVVSAPTCGACLGGFMGILAAGEKCISTTNRNFVGRMGSPKSEVYLASPATAAASAIEGKLADCRNYL